MAMAILTPKLEGGKKSKRPKEQTLRAFSRGEGTQIQKEGTLTGNS